MSVIKTAADNYFIFGEHSSKDWGIILSGDNVFDSPARDVTKYSVPGRNGDLIVDNGRWNNVDVTYNDCLIANNFPEKFADFRAQMGKLRGYVRLEDTFNPDEYRMANMSNGLKIKQLGTRYHSGRFDLTFNCKPQRFLKSGEIPIQFMPPSVVSTSNRWDSQLIKAIEGERIEFYINRTDAIEQTAYFITYDADFNQVRSETYGPAYVGFKPAAFTANEAYWQLKVEGIPADDVTSVKIGIKGKTVCNGEELQLDALMTRQISLSNPTGYAARPLFEVYHTRVPVCYMTTSGDNAAYYQFRSNPTGVEHFYLDCDDMYMYDDAHTNLTNYFRLENAESMGAYVQGLVFPELGTDTTILRMNFGTAPTNEYNGVGLIKLYPRWWRL